MRVNEIFVSLQGEGHFTGKPSIFLRLSGCNLQCPFCDTDHSAGTPMSEDEIAESIAAYAPRHVVITGGEPSLFLTGSLVDKLHALNKFVAVETNGTHPLPQGVDWITLSPKFPFFATPQAAAAAQIRIPRCHELKAIFISTETFSAHEAALRSIPADNYYVQPCHTPNDQQNKAIIADAVKWCINHPQWSLSLQTHKLLGIP